MMNLFPPELKDSVPGALGALASIPFQRGSLMLRLCKGVSAALIALYASEPVASHVLLNPKLQGLVGLMLGAFGALIVQKLYDVLEAIGAVEIGRAFTDMILRKLKGEP